LSVDENAQGGGAGEAAASSGALPGGGAPGGTSKKVRMRRTKAAFAKVPHPPKGSKRFVALTIASTALVVGAVVGGVMWFIPYSESVSFCTTCHTMIPQHKSFEVSAHSDVACGECHVEPTIQGWLKAKIAGTQELKALILNNYPTPIPPIPHADLPSTEVTCQKCHSLERINTPGNPIKLILRPRYETDEANTMQMVAVAIRPTGLGSSLSAESGGASNTTQVDTSAGASTQLDPRGVHWHVATPVAVFSTDEQGQTIPLVEYTNEDGELESFVASSEITLPSDVSPDIARLKANTIEHKMNCIDCHNMVGHNIPNPSVALDSAMSEGAISPNLPYIKRDALAVIKANYPTEEDADIAIDAFSAAYTTKHPLVMQQGPEEMQSAIEEIRRIYHETSTPAMKTVWDSYPDNLGHQRSPGCFRCHDGAHVKVVNGSATDQIIPSTCSTCHTFPQVGSTVSGLQLGVPPVSHTEKLYVFNHKDSVPSVEAAFAADAPADANCSTCHQKSYCENCHNSGAIKVTHDEMLYNHAESVRKSSLTACAYCHQPVYCATCHSNDIMGVDGLNQVRLNTAGEYDATKSG
jgi:nitrate/TMAO reductase-like tetraheme cytochrome c subunit